MVKLSVQDNVGGAGLLETLYSIEDTPEYYQVYDGPFQLPEGATKVTAMSTDRGGNTEYPSAVLDLSAPLATAATAGSTPSTTLEGSDTDSETGAQGFPWLILLGVGLALLVLAVILVIARKKSRKKKVESENP